MKLSKCTFCNSPHTWDAERGKRYHNVKQGYWRVSFSLGLSPLSLVIVHLLLVFWVCVILPDLSPPLSNILHVAGGTLPALSVAHCLACHELCHCKRLHLLLSLR